MKKSLLITFTVLFCNFSVFSEQKSTIINDILTEHVSQKVEQMQHLIKFSDEQSNRLKELELNFLLDVQKAENCICCNTKKKVEKLKINREQNLQKILTQPNWRKKEFWKNTMSKFSELKSNPSKIRKIENYSKN